MYGSSCSYTKLYQAWSLPYIAVHAVIPRPIRLVAFRVRQFMQVIPRPIRLKSFHVWQFTQSSRDLSGVKLSINGSSCSYSKTYQAWSFPCKAVHASYPKTYQAWSFPCMADHAVIPRHIRLEGFHVWQFMQLSLFCLILSTFFFLFLCIPQGRGGLQYCRLQKVQGCTLHSSFGVIELWMWTSEVQQWYCCKKEKCPRIHLINCMKCDGAILQRNIY